MAANRPVLATAITYSALRICETVMLTLDFKGKQLAYAHHLTIPSIRILFRGSMN